MFNSHLSILTMVLIISKCRNCKKNETFVTHFIVINLSTAPLKNKQQKK
jgi:hypothetical protein